MYCIMRSVYCTAHNTIHILCMYSTYIVHVYNTYIVYVYCNTYTAHNTMYIQYVYVYTIYVLYIYNICIVLCAVRIALLYYAHYCIKRILYYIVNTYCTAHKILIALRKYVLHCA